jgi:DNA-binding transcriptional LysR family regulator
VLRQNASDLVAFMTVARAGSFTRAAVELGVSQPALSHAVRELETRLGLRLLNRTTRSVAPTESGARLLRTITPHIEGIEAGLVALTEMRSKPAGTLRITAPQHAAETVLWPALAGLLAEYPDINVELVTDDLLTDIVSERFDAGVRLGESIEKDMIAVRIGPEMRMAIVGSPDYFAARPAPRAPDDLGAHNCINLRRPTRGDSHPWEFDKDGRSVKVRVEGQIVLTSLPLIRQAALAGLGLAYLPDDVVEDDLRRGRLVRVLEDWCEPFPGYQLYYPSRHLHEAAFAVLVEALRHRSGKR